MLKQESQQNTKIPFASHQEKIIITAITWNLFGSLPPINSLVDLLASPNFHPTPDILFFGTQQCQRSLCLSFCCEAKAEWQQMLSEVFTQFEIAVTETMGGLHSAILIRKGLKDHFEVDSRQKLKAGACNMIGNKGAISIQLTVLGHQFQFINCHLAAHQHQTQQRNATINRILDSLLRKDLHTEVILLGDLNYRIEMEQKEYNQMLLNRNNTEEEMKYTSYLGREQLSNQHQLKIDFLKRFQEGALSFPPTYKIGVNRNEYNKERIPGWTDRIFHRKSKKITRTNYSCEYGIMGSDHRPVIARYERQFQSFDYSLQSENFVGVKSKGCQLI